MCKTKPSPIILSRAVASGRTFWHDGWEVALSSHRSPFKSTYNEDSAGVIPIGSDLLVAIVADGCGGMRGGEQAAGLAVRLVARNLKKCSGDSKCIRGAILDGIEQANNAIQRLKIGAACTIAVAECSKNRVRTYHVGDSMILVTDPFGKIRFQSLCHSPVGYAVESGWLGANKAMYHDQRNLVSNLVGSSSMSIDVGPWIPLRRQSTVIIGSDGLFDNLTTKEVAQRTRYSQLDECVRRLSRLAGKRMKSPQGSTPSKPDDLTIISIRCARQ